MSGTTNLLGSRLIYLLLFADVILTALARDSQGLRPYRFRDVPAIGVAGSCTKVHSHRRFHTRTQSPPQGLPRATAHDCHPKACPGRRPARPLASWRHLVAARGCSLARPALPMAATPSPTVARAVHVLPGGRGAVETPRITDRELLGRAHRRRSRLRAGLFGCEILLLGVLVAPWPAGPAHYRASPRAVAVGVAHRMNVSRWDQDKPDAPGSGHRTERCSFRVPVLRTARRSLH